MSATITYTSSLRQATRSKDHVVLCASKAALNKGIWKKVFAGSWANLVGSMLKGAEPGTLGKVVSTYTGAKAPSRVSVVVLPDALSRYAAPSRSDAFAACAGKVDLSGAKRVSFVLCLDEADDLIVDGTGAENTQAIYDGEEASETIKKMLEFCAAFHRQSLATREFVDELESRDLFRPGTVTITNESGEQFNLRGFRMVDEAKFNALPDEAFLEFRRKGWLHAITSHLVSVQNLAALGFRSKASE